MIEIRDMVMGTERSKALHNFTMPCGLRWGNQRYLRCMKVNSNGQISTVRHENDSDSSDYQHQPQSSQRRRTTREKQSHSNGSYKTGPATAAAESFGAVRRFVDGGDDGIAAVREKVMFDLQAVADQMKHQIFKEGLEEGEVAVSPSPPPPRPPPPPPPPPVGSYKPWNLRTRRAACKAPLTGFVAGAPPGGSDSRKALTVDVMKPSSSLSPMRTPPTGDNPPRLRIGAAVESPSGEKRERPKFSVPLLRREIEEDFIAMVGHRPPRRPKKRTKIVQKELDTLFPGLWLSEITPEMYKVTEPAP